MNNFRFFLLIIFLVISVSCTKDTTKKSVILEKDLELQVLEAYEEGLKS